VQREVNEVEHTLSQMAVPKKLKPQPEEVMQLRRGQFFVCFEDVLRRVYVLPRWMPADVGFKIAMVMPAQAGELMVKNAIAKFQPARIRRQEEENVDYKAAYEQSQENIQRLETRIAELEDRGKPSVLAPTLAAAPASTNGDDVAAMSLSIRKPVIDVTVHKYLIEASDENTNGRLALLISEGFFDQARRIQDLYPEFRARGWMKQTGAPSPLNLPLAKLTEMGFLRMVGTNTYQSVPGMKVNVKEVTAVA
jgi:hypothetical protein